jgi:hypothetical protein
MVIARVLCFVAGKCNLCLINPIFVPTVGAVSADSRVVENPMALESCPVLPSCSHPPFSFAHHSFFFHFPRPFYAGPCNTMSQVILHRFHPIIMPPSSLDPHLHLRPSPGR